MYLRQLRKAVKASQPFSRLINLLCFDNGNVIWTRTGDALLVIRYRGCDTECSPPEVKDSLTAGLRSTLTNAFNDSRFVITQCTIKSPSAAESAKDYPTDAAYEAIRNRDEYLRGKADELYSIETYLVVLFKSVWKTPRLADWLAFAARHPRRALRQALKKSSRIAVLDETLEDTKQHLLRGANSFLEQTRDVLAGEVLGPEEAFSLFRRLVIPNRAKADALRLPSKSDLNYFIPDSVLECHPGHLTLDGRSLKTITLKSPPAHTHSDLLRALLKVPGSVTVATEWSFLDSDTAVSLIESKRRHFHNTKLSLFSGVASETSPEREKLYNESNEAHVADLGELRTAIELKSVRIAELSLSVVLTGRTLKAVEQSAAEVMKVFGTFEAAGNEERYNGLSAFLATLPGGYPYNHRKLLATNENVADLACWFTPATGEKVNNFLKREWLITFETEDKSLFYFNLHIEDIAHALVVGSTGTGKTFVLAALLTHAQKYQPIIIIFDVGGSYRSLTRLHGGNYIQVRPDHLPFFINPFSVEPTPKNLQFLFLFFKLLIEHGGYVMNDADDRDLFSSISAIYVLEPEQRRLLTVSTTLRRDLGEHLRPWTEGEQYGMYFDHVPDTVSFAVFQCIDFEGMERMGAVVEPLLFYLLYRADDFIYDPAKATTFKLFVADEAWKFFKHKVTRRCQGICVNEF